MFRWCIAICFHKVVLMRACSSSVPLETSPTLWLSWQEIMFPKVSVMITDTQILQIHVPLGRLVDIFFFFFVKADGWIISIYWWLFTVWPMLHLQQQMGVWKMLRTQPSSANSFRITRIYLTQCTTTQLWQSGWVWGEFKLLHGPIDL